MPHSSTSNSENNGRLKTFAKTLGVFFLPVVVLVVIAQVWCFRYGENWTLKMVRDAEVREVGGGKETLFHRLVIAEEMRRYKLGELAHRNPRVIVAGSSTSMQFRSFMFGECAGDFYNAGGLTNSIDQLDDLLSVLRLLQRVQLVFLGIDMWWLNPNWTGSPSDGFGAGTHDRELALDLRTSLLALPDVVRRGQKKGWNWLRSVREASSSLPPEGHVAIGLGGRNGDGFRGTDGSRRYAFVAKRARTGGPFVDLADTHGKIGAGATWFPFASVVADERLRKLESFLTAAAEQGIVIAGYSIPLEPSVHDAITRSEKHRAFYVDYLEATREVFQRAGQPFVHAHDPRAWGFDSRHMIDGFHASEVVIARLVLEFLKLPGVNSALERCRIYDLDRQIATAPSPVSLGGLP